MRRGRRSRNRRASCDRRPVPSTGHTEAPSAPASHSTIEAETRALRRRRAQVIRRTQEAHLLVCGQCRMTARILAVIATKCADHAVCGAYGPPERSFLRTRHGSIWIVPLCEQMPPAPVTVIVQGRVPKEV